MDTQNVSTTLTGGFLERQTMSFSVAAPARPSSGHSPYLAFHRNGLIFRIRVPADLQICLGKTEYRRSIGRCYATEAKHRAFKLAAAAFEVFSFTRQVLNIRSGTLTEHCESGKECGPTGYTLLHGYQRKNQVTQDNYTAPTGYTGGLQSRALSSLTDDEIRSIADMWLLAALKGADLFALQMAHIRNQNEPKAEDLEYRTTADTTAAANIKAVYQTDLKARRPGRMAAEADRQLPFTALSVTRKLKPAQRSRPCRPKHPPHTSRPVRSF